MQSAKYDSHWMNSAMSLRRKTIQLKQKAITEPARRHLVNSRVNQALANFQSRMTLCGESFRISAVLFHAEPSEEAQFNDTRFARVHFGKGIERVIDGDQFTVPPGGNVRDLIQIKRVRMIDAFDLTSALG